LRNLAFSGNNYIDYTYDKDRQFNSAKGWEADGATPACRSNSGMATRTRHANHSIGEANEMIGAGGIAASTFGLVLEAIPKMFHLKFHLRGIERAVTMQ